MQALRRFGGSGPVALSVFPDPITGEYKPGWQSIGDALKSLLTPEEYESGRRTVFSQFFTVPVVMQAMHGAMDKLGVPADATVLQPGCRIENFKAADLCSMTQLGHWAS